MSRIKVPRFRSIDKSVSSRDIMDEMASDGRNIIFENSRVKTRWGYDNIGTNLPLNGVVTIVSEYRELRGDDTTKVVCTASNLYIYNEVSTEWEVITPAENTGTVTWPTSGSTYSIATAANTVICSPATNKIAIAYSDTADTNKGKCIVGTIDASNVITFGAALEFESGITADLSICSPSTDKIAVAYRDQGDSNKGKCVATTISGTTLAAYGAIAEFESGSTSSISICSPASDKIAIAYRDNGDGDKLKCVATTLTGKELDAFGAIDETGYTTDQQVGICSPDTDKIAIAFSDDGNSDRGYCIANTISGKTLGSWGAVSQFRSTPTVFGISACSPSTDKVTIAFNDGQVSDITYCTVGTLSGVTFGTWGNTIEIGGGSTTYPSVDAIATDKIAIVYGVGGSNTYIKFLTITGSALSVWNIESSLGSISGGVVSSFASERVVIAGFDDNAVAYDAKLQGSGTAWSALWATNTYKIKFGTNSVMGTGVPDFWYTVGSYIDATTASLAEYPRLTQSGVVYVMRFDFASTESDYFDACNMVQDLTAQNEWLIMTNGVEPPVKYTGSGQSTDLGGNPPYAKYCMVYYGHLLLGNCKDNITAASIPQSVYWSVRGNPEDWSNSGYGFVDLLDNDDEITGMEILGERAFIFKERSIVGCTYTGQADPAFVFTEDMITEVGCPSGRTIVNTGREIIFLSSDNVYSFNGFEIAPVGSPIIDDLLGVLNTTYDYKSHAVNLPTKNLYCLFITTTSDTNPDRCYVYHYYEKSWTIWALADNITSTTVLEDDTIMMGDSAGYVYLIDFTDTDDNGTNISAYIDTKDFNFVSQQIGEFTARINESVVRLRDKAGQVNVYASTDHGNSWSLAVTINQNITEEMRDHLQNWLLRSRHVMFRIENVSSSEFEIESFEISLERSGTNRR